MKTIIVKIVIVICICFLISKSQVTNGHDPNGIVLNQILQLLNSNFGNDFTIKGYEILDSILVSDSTKDFSYNQYTDSYGTLRHCNIFWATKKQAAEFYDDQRNYDTSVICIVKNNSLIWNSGIQIKGQIDSLLFSYDLNKDNKIDLGFVIVEFNKTDFARLYVVSWDGATGEIINTIDDDGQSTVLSSRGSLYEIFDTNNDGIYEIRSIWKIEGEGSGWFPSTNPSSTAPYVTYGWNGNRYGFWGDIRQVPGFEFLPYNKIKLISKCSVEIVNNNFKYSYLFKSDNSSKQLIENIYIENIDSAGTTGFGPWDGSFSWILESYYWSPFSSNRTKLLHADQEMSGFGFLSSKLPTIKTIYAQGSNALGDVESDDRTDESIINDAKINSYSTKTIGPDNTTGLFIPLNFLDTLTSYTTQSRTLGWITNQTTANKYLNYFASAKTQLQASNTSGAKTTLQQVLVDVNVDSTNNLKSEAYALLRFNTEYLKTQLQALDTIYVPTQYSTIQSAINAATANKIVLVGAGTYNELVSINTKNSLTLLTRTNAIIQGVYISNANTITVKGFTINASSTTKDGIEVAGTSNSNITIEANQIQNSTKSGITLVQSSANTRIFNNVIVNNQQNGIAIANGATGTQYIINNTLVNNGNIGVQSVAPQKLYLVNNIIVFQSITGKSGLRLVNGASSSISSLNNMVVTNQSGLLQSDYRLTTTSRGKDKGTTNFNPLPLKDKDGNTRIVGISIDLGAYEIQ